MAMAYAYDDDDDKYGFGFDEAEDFEEDAVPCRCSMRGGARPSLHNLRLPSAALIVPVRKRSHKFIGKGRSQLLRERTIRNRVVGDLSSEFSSSSVATSASPRGRGRGRGSSRGSPAPEGPGNAELPCAAPAAGNNQLDRLSGLDAAENTPSNEEATRITSRHTFASTDYRTKLLETASRFQNDAPFDNLVSTFAKPDRGGYTRGFDNNEDDSSSVSDGPEIYWSDENEDCNSQKSSEREYVIPERYRHDDEFQDACNFYSQIRPSRNLGDFITQALPRLSKSNKPKNTFSFPQYKAKKKVAREELFGDAWVQKPEPKPKLHSREEFPCLGAPPPVASGAQAPAFSMSSIAGGLLSAGQSAAASSAESMEDSLLTAGETPSNPDHVVCIDNLPTSCETDFLVAMLSPYGEVRSCRLEHTEHGSLRAEIEMNHADACEWAVDCLNGEDAALAGSGLGQRLVCYRLTSVD